MNDFVGIEVLGTMAGCSLIITLLTQVFKRYLPEKLDTKWLALAFSIIIGVLRIIYVGQYDFSGIVAGIFNIFVLLAASIGIYEIGGSALDVVARAISPNGGNEDVDKK